MHQTNTQKTAPTTRNDNANLDQQNAQTTCTNLHWQSSMTTYTGNPQQQSWQFDLSTVTTTPIAACPTALLA